MRLQRELLLLTGAKAPLSCLQRRPKSASKALAAVVVLALCGCGSPAAGQAHNSPSGSASATTVPPRLETLATAEASASTASLPTRLTEDNWGQVVFEASRSDLSQYKGIAVELTGQVFNIESDSTRVGVQMWVYPTRAEGNTVVVFDKQGAPSVSNGDVIKVEGTVDGRLVRTNDRGVVLQLPRVAATSVQILVKASATASAPPSPTPSTSAAAKPTIAPSPTRPLPIATRRP